MNCGAGLGAGCLGASVCRWKRLCVGVGESLRCSSEAGQTAFSAYAAKGDGHNESGAPTTGVAVP